MLKANTIVPLSPWVFALFLGGCSTTSEPAVRIVEVKVPIIRACVSPDVPAAPSAYADANASSLPPDERYRVTAQANLERKARLARVEPVVQACR